MRTTCSSASALRNGGDVEQRLRRRSAAGRAAMSANSTVAGTRFFGLKSAVRLIEARIGHARDADVRVLPCPCGAGAPGRSSAAERARSCPTREIQ